MDPNLTYPIILNVTLNQPPQNQLSNPAIIALFGVVIGGIITYYANLFVDKNKRRYELKKETYIELLDIILELQRIFIDTQIVIDNTPDLLSDHRCRSPEEMELDKSFKEIAGNLRLIQFKLQLCNGSKKIEGIIDDILAKLVVDARSNIDDIIKNELTQALEEELAPRCWWQFRR